MLALVFLWGLAAAARADSPRTLAYRGHLTDTQGRPVNAALNLTFALYGQETGGAALWSETHPGVTVKTGVFAVILGGANPLGLEFDQPYWLALAVNGGPELAPRRPLTGTSSALGPRAAGPTGPVGPQGPAGPQGTKGAPGAQGDPGDTGAKGAKGDQGDTGATGAAGPQGPTGLAAPDRVVMVREGESIQAAIDAITDAAPDKRYLVWVGPGVFHERITLKPYVNLAGSGPGFTQISHPGSDDPSLATLTAAAYTEIRDLAVANTGGAGAPFYAIAVYALDTAPLRLGNLNLTAENATTCEGLRVSGNSVCEVEGGVIAATGGASDFNGAVVCEGAADVTLWETKLTAAHGNQAVGLYATDNSTAKLRSCVLDASGGTENHALYVYDDDSDPVTLKLADCQLNGSVHKGSGNTVICLGCFGADLAARASDCQ
ncbi:MAG: hypothetical protein KQJ78_14065 [Deltaproteobacteria bacterium]|nr:hypothetical protein [Deltaproteobacteria bacterium]